MRDNKQDLEQRLANILSEYVDQLNEGVAPPIEGFLKRYESLTQDMKAMLEVISFVKDETQLEEVPEWKKTQVFEKIYTEFITQNERKQIRETIEHGTATLPLDKRTDFLILLLHTMKEIWGITKVFKFLFLMGKEEHLDNYVPDYYSYCAYNYGPFEKAIYEDIEALKQYGLIEERKPRKKKYKADEEIEEVLYPEKVQAIYQLSNKGEQIAQALMKSAQKKDPGIIKKINTIKSKYGYLSLKELLKYIYNQYPEYAKNSKIKKEILERDENDS